MQTLRDLINTSFVFSDVNDEDKSKMIDELADIAVQRTVIRCFEKMEDAEVEEFEKTIGKDTDPTKIFGYLETNVPSFYDMLKEEVIRLQALAEQENK